MSKLKIENNHDDNDGEIKIDVKNRSSVAEFTKRPVPTDKEIEKFDEQINEEAKEEDIEKSLSEIYKDDDGDMVNVKKLEIKKKHGFLFWFFNIVFILACFAGAGYGIYYFYTQSGSDSRNVELSIEGKSRIMAGEEFFWTVNFKNLDKVDITNIEIRLNFPENFIFIDSQPSADIRDDTWHFDLLGSNKSAFIKVKGKFIGNADKIGIILADMTYTPANFSSEFKKSDSFESIIKGAGIELLFVHANSVMVGEEESIIIKYKALPENYLNNFRLTVESFSEENQEEYADNIEFIKPDKDELKQVNQEYLDTGVWQINEINEDEQEIEIKFKFKDKIVDSQNLIFKFENSVNIDGAQYYLFAEEIINLEIIKSDLNLGLIINGSQIDQGVDFGQILNYSIVYANKGEAQMKDIVIMAVMESEFLNWKELNEKNNGKIQGDTISWSKEEIPSLAELEKNEEGVIDFSIKIADLSEIDFSKDYQVKSYSQYVIGDLTEEDEVNKNEDKQSNVIINKINSDLRLSEQVRYFNDDNIAVGFGPQPPKVGEITSYKVYWTVENNLHELNNLEVQVSLPYYVSWGDKKQSTAGDIQYDSETHKIIWKIGRMPAAIYRIDAEFDINISPTENDKNKIMVLLPGTIVQAIDSETHASISRSGKVKTTKLEDEEAIIGDGRVVK